MPKSKEDGGVACGICRVSLQEATLAFGVADVVHGILGISVVISMIIKQENDRVHKDDKVSEDRISGYTKFLDKKCPLWFLLGLFGAFIFQIALGFFLSIGASQRNYVLCQIWFVGSLLTSAVNPITYCLLFLGRIYQWATVGEFIWRVENLYEVGFNARDRKLDVPEEERRRNDINEY